MLSRLSPRPHTRVRTWLALVLTLITTALLAVVPVPTAQAAEEGLPWLKTSGNRIVVASTGQDVILRGANVLRSEWDLQMSAERRAIPALANDWKGNVIVRGFASDPVNANDSQYLNMLDEHVTLAAAHRMYVVFVWRSHNINGQQPTMPDDRAQQALATLAKRYHGVSNVMYALQVEPHDVSWSTPQPRFVRMVDAIRAAASPLEPRRQRRPDPAGRPRGHRLQDPPLQAVHEHLQRRQAPVFTRWSPKSPPSTRYSPTAPPSRPP